MVSVDPQEGVDDLIEMLDRGDFEAARRRAEQLRQDLAPTALLTTTQAARMLGIRSRNTVRALLRAEDIPVVMTGNRTMIPLGDVLRLRKNRAVQRAIATLQLHSSSALLGSDDGLSQEDLDALEATRPGRNPWETT